MKLFGGRGSLERQLAVRMTVVLAGAIGLSFAAFIYQSFVVTQDLRDQSLQAQAREIAAHLRRSPDGGVRVDLPPEEASLYTHRNSGYFFAVFGAGDRPVATSSDALARRFVESIPTGTAARFFRIDRADPDDRFYGYISSAQGLRIVVAQGRVHRDVLFDSLFEEFFESTLAWFIPLVALAVWLGVMTLRAGLKPIEALSQQVRELGLETPDRRLPEAGVPREILPLVHAFNDALDRLDQGMRAHRRFIADTAHQLRTPVTLMRARLESAAGEDLDPEGLRNDVLRLDRLIGQLLRIARLDATQPVLADTVELNRLARDRIAEIAALALREGREIVLDAAPDPVTVKGDTALLGEALSNLIENALRHTPAGTPVSVRVDPCGALDVLDRGPGVPEGQRAAIFDRFWQPPGGAGNGSGLGLAIAAEIARLHRGEISVDDRPGGGAAFRLTVPRDGGPAGEG